MTENEFRRFEQNNDSERAYEINNNNGGEYVYVSAPENRPKKRRSGAGFAAAVLSLAVVLGVGAGIVGTVIGNFIATASIADSANIAYSQSEESQREVETLPVNSNVSQRPLDYSKIEDEENTTLLNSEELYEKVKDTVVLVYNYQNVYGYDEPVKAGSASGVVFTADGYILTNAHVVSNAAKMTVVVSDYNDPDVTHEYEAEIVGSDSITDIAVIKVTRSDPFHYALLGNSDTVRVGQDVCVLGNPKSLINSLTKGIVSGLDRESISKSSYSCSTIQVDAAVNSGNSGGGLFDMYGNVIGIIDYKLVSTSTSESIDNIGFAITINEARNVANDLMQYGYVKNRPGLGISGEEVTEYIAYTYGINHAGVYVTYISENKPIAQSGLRIGDVITEVNGNSVSTISDIQAEVTKYSIGDTVELTVYRKNEIGAYKSIKLTAELSELELQ